MDGTREDRSASRPDSSRSSVRHYSGILVSAIPGRLEEARRGASALAGVEVRESDPASGRFVIVLETADRKGQAEGLEALSALPGVATADLVTHVVDHDLEPVPPEEEQP